MPCLAIIFAFFGPRIALFVVWLTSDLIGRAIEMWWVALAGFFLLPWTTLTYVVLFHYGLEGGVVGFEQFLVAGAFLVDAAAYLGSRLRRR